MVDGIPVLSPTCLIPFKAKAWLDLKERKLNGEQVDSKIGRASCRERV